MFVILREGMCSGTAYYRKAEKYGGYWVSKIRDAKMFEDRGEAEKLCVKLTPEVTRSLYIVKEAK